jgi:hypothetical protein
MARVPTASACSRWRSPRSNPRPGARVYLKPLPPRPCPVPGNLVGIAPEDVRVAMPITIGYQEIPSEDITIWRWVALG